MLYSPLDYFPNGLSPREWQVAFLKKFELFAQRQLVCSLPEREAFLLNAFPGSGKTFAQLAAMAWLYKQRAVDFLVVVVPSDFLRRQFATEARAFGLYMHEKPNLKVKMIGDQRGHNGIVLTYHQLNNPETVAILQQWCQEMKVFVFADEMHHLGDNSWGSNFADAFNMSVIRGMTTGTPFRSDGERIPWVRYSGDTIDLSGPAAYSFGYGFNRWNRELCALYGRADGNGEGASVRDVLFHPWDGEIEWTVRMNGVEEHFQHRLSDNIEAMYPDRTEAERNRIRMTRRRACIECGTERHPNGTAYVRDQIVAAHQNLMQIRQTHYWASGLIVCQNRRHADAIALVVRELTGTTPVVIHGDVPEARRSLEAFREDTTCQRAPWLLAVKMVTEGVDVKHIRQCLYMTVETAPLFWTQVLGRVIRLEGGLSAEDQTAHFYQYDDGVDDVRGVAEDVRLRKYALNITAEMTEVRLKREQAARPTGAPGTAGNGFVPWEVDCVSATGEAHHQVYDGEEHRIADLAPYIPISIAWHKPAAVCKSMIEKLPPGTLERLLESIK